MLLKTTLFLLLLVAPANTAFTPVGTWAWHGPWQRAPKGEAHTANADGVVVTFCSDGRLRIASGTLYRTTEQAALGSSDGLALYEGRWMVREGLLEATYSLVDAEIRSSDYEKLVNTKHEVTVAREGDRLRFTLYRAFDGVSLNLQLSRAVKSSPVISDRFAECSPSGK